MAPLAVVTYTTFRIMELCAQFSHIVTLHMLFLQKFIFIMGVRTVRSKFTFSEMNYVFAHLCLSLHFHVLIKFLPFLSICEVFLGLLPGGLAVGIPVSKCCWWFIDCSLFKLFIWFLIWIWFGCYWCIWFLVNFWNHKIRLHFWHKCFTIHFHLMVFGMTAASVLRENIFCRRNFAWSSSTSERVLFWQIVLILIWPRVHRCLMIKCLRFFILIWGELLSTVRWKVHNVHCV